MSELERAVSTMRKAMLAESTKATYRSRLKLWEKMSGKMGFEPFPLDEKKMERITAALREANYRSAADYLSTAIAFNELLGYKLSSCQRAYARRIKTACERHIGGPKQAEPLTLGVLMSLCKSASGFFAKQRAASYVLGSWFLLRGDELLSLKVSHVSIGQGNTSVSIIIEGSKTDQRLCGEKRQLGAICTQEGDDVGLICPVRAAAYLLQSRTQQGAAPDHLLCTNSKSCRWTQKEFRRLLKEDLAKAGIQGWIGYSLHSMRAGGCQWLLRAGIERNKVKKFGRWRSDCINRYAREAYIADSLGYSATVVDSQGAEPAKSSGAAGTAGDVIGRREHQTDTPAISNVEKDWIVESMQGDVHPWLS